MWESVCAAFVRRSVMDLDVRESWWLPALVDLMVGDVFVRQCPPQVVSIEAAYLWLGNAMTYVNDYYLNTL